MHKEVPYMGCIPQRDGFPPSRMNEDRKMAKTAEKVTDIFANVEFPSFDASKATDQIRAFAEKGVEQSKEAYAKLRSGAEEAQKALETTFEAAKSASGDLSLKTIATMRSNAEAGFSHLELLVGAKSISEVIELQSAYLRKNVELAVEQAKDFQAAASKAAEDVSLPIKAVVEKAFKELKVA